jgi:hypothetical protein
MSVLKLRSPWVLGLALCFPAFQSAAAPPAGPLRIHPENPRYFTDGARMPDGSWRAVYLTGAHTWNNLVDIGRSDPPEKFNWESYLNFLEKHHHNFIEWIDPSRPEPAGSDRLSAEDGIRQFQAPFAGSAVLHLKAQKARQ